MRGIFLLMIFFAAILFSMRMGGEPLFRIPYKWPKPKYDFSKNPLSSGKVELGRALFYDPILSRDSTISCASCHSQFTAFTHVDHALSHGIEDKTGTRNSPALMNLAWHPFFMWDGAINHLDMQALAPISHPAEMDESIAHVVQKLQRSRLYPQLFAEAFQDSVVTGERTLKALSQFLLTLVSSDSKYDSVMRKEAEFSAQEKRGYQLFRKNCETCHREPLFSSFRFENNGLPPDTGLLDAGRMKVTQRKEDSLKFKVPSLRNIEFSYPYMHDGRFRRIQEVLNHYTSGIENHPGISPPLRRKMVMTSEDKIDLTAFLLTLTDRHFLFNPAYFYPKEIFQASPKD